MSKLVKCKVQDLILIHNNKRIPLSSKQRESLKKVYPYYGAQGIVDYVDNYIFDGEYILVAEDGENLRSNNQNICNLVNNKFWVNNHAHIISANDNNITKYLYYNFNLINFEPYVTGSAQPKLNKENLLNIETNVHTKTDQQKIATVLSSLDDKIDLSNKINAQLEAMAKTLYNYWFVQFDFPDAQGKPYKSSGGKMVYNGLLKREIPQGWEVKSLGEIATKLVRGISPKYIENGGIPVINQKCIRNKSLNFRFCRNHDNETKKINSKDIYVGDILINSTGVGTLGRVAIVKWLENQLTTADSHVTIVRINGAIVSPLFAGYCLTEKQKEIEELGEGSTGQTELSRDNLSGLKFLIPNLNEDKNFANRLEPIFQKMANNEKQNQELTTLRDWLLPMLMNGQVTVGEASE